VSSSSTAGEVMLVTSGPRYILARKHRYDLRPLPGRDTEMRLLNKAIFRQLHMVPGAVWPDDVDEALRRFTPRVIVISGHYVNGSWAAEAPSGRSAVLVGAAQIANMLHKHAIPQVIILNGCNSASMGRQLAALLQGAQQGVPDKGCYIVGCASKLLNDDFAASFSSTLCTLIAHGTLPQEAFQATCRELAEAGRWKMGDPAQFRNAHLSPAVCEETATTTASGAKCSKFDPNCPGCNPPVHGRFELIQVP